MKRFKPLLVFLALILFWVAGVSGFVWLYRTFIVPTPYIELVSQYSREYKVPVALIYAVMKAESGFDPNSKSVDEAMGLMQILPNTFSWLLQRSGAPYTPEQIYDPQANIHMGTYYLSWLYQKFGNWPTALAAYNAGHNKVKQWLENFPEIFKNGQILPDAAPNDETRTYLKRTLSYRIQYEKFYA